MVRVHVRPLLLAGDGDKCVRRGPGVGDAVGNRAAPGWWLRVPWQAEPFRIFFPLGAFLAWVGIGHWVLYGFALTRSYSCMAHGFVQVQAFLPAFGAGFLFTALPRRTQTPPASGRDLVVTAALLVCIAVAGAAESWIVAEAAYGALCVFASAFAMRRFLRRAAGRRPPAAFALLPIGLGYGIAGATLVGLGTIGFAPWTIALGKLFIEQGVFLCLVLGAGALILPLIGGTPVPADLDRSRAEWGKAGLYAAAGLGIGASLVAEFAGFARLAPLVRGAIVALGLAAGGRIWKPPRKPGFHRRVVWVSAWLIPTGLAASGIFPGYRMPALHILFIGGFATLAFGVATHVSLGHLGLQELSLGRPLAVIAMAIAFALALLARLAADASHTYFAHLTSAAIAWLAGSAIWLAFLVPRLLRPPGSSG